MALQLLFIPLHTQLTSSFPVLFSSSLSYDKHVFVMSVVVDQITYSIHRNYVDFVGLHAEIAVELAVAVGVKQ